MISLLPASLLAAIGIIAATLLTASPAICQTAQPSGTQPSATQPSGSKAGSTAPAVNCKSAPVTMTFGGTPWLVHGCSDRHSVIIVAAPGSPAAPFDFMFYWQQGLYTLLGNGTGDKQVAGKAYAQLSIFSRADIEALVAKTHAP